MTTSNTFLPNIQVYPAKNFKIAIDNLTRQMFEMCIDGKDEISLELVESHFKNIHSSIKISNLNSLKVKFTEFEYAVFDSTISERIAENEYTTAAILCRHLGCWHTPSPEIQKAVIHSLDKLACIRIIANLDGTQKFYNSPIGDFEFRGYLLPSESLSMSINGQPSTLIHFLSKGPVFAIAEMKDQIITCPSELMQAPVRTTPRTIAINHFLLRRILEIKGSVETSKTNKRVKPLRHTILVDSLYKACGMEHASKFQKQDARKTANSVLNFFVEKNLIKNFSYETGKGGKIRAINFNF
jgi:hypothetical protein